MAPFRLRLAVGIGLVLLGLLGALTAIFFTGSFSFPPAERCPARC